MVREVPTVSVTPLGQTARVRTAVRPHHARRPLAGTVQAGNSGRRTAQAEGLLGELRGDTTRRPQVDPGLAGGLREWLEDGVSDATASLPGGSVIVDPRSLSWALGGTEGDGTAPEWTIRLAKEALVDVLFRQQVTMGGIGDALEDALAAVRAEGRTSLVDFVEHLPRSARTVLDHELGAHAVLLGRHWAPLAPGWLPRTHDKISIPLAGGRVVLTAEVDLVLGVPCAGQASVCLVAVTSGAPNPSQRADRHFCALLETIRSGAPPCRLATYYSASGRIDAEDVPDALLAHAVQRTITGTARLCEWASRAGTG